MFEITERYEFSNHSDGFSLIVNDSSSYGLVVTVFFETAHLQDSVVGKRSYIVTIKEEVQVN